MDKDKIKRAVEQMDWEIGNCGKRIEDCVSCQDCKALSELAHQYIDGKLIPASVA